MIVGESADHQDLVAAGEVVGQQRHEAFEQLPALGLQPVGIELEEHAAADADTAIGERDAPGGQRHGQRLLERLASLLLGALAPLGLGLEPARQLELHAYDADQHQHEGAEQPRHQVAEHRPDGRRVLQARFAAVVGHS